MLSFWLYILPKKVIKIGILTRNKAHSVAAFYPAFIWKKGRWSWKMK